MKIFAMLLFFLLGCVDSLHAVPVLSEKSTPEERRKFAEKLDLVQEAEQRAGLVEDAFSKRDIQLIRMCFEHPRTATWMYKKIREEKSLDLKAELTILALRWNKEGDESPENLFQGSRGVPIGLYICLEVIADLLPEEGLKANDPNGIEALKSPAFRSEMAAKLEEYLKKSELPSIAKPPSPELADLTSPGDAIIASPNPLTEPKGGNFEMGSYWLIGGGAAIMGLFLLVGIKLRKRRSH